MSAYEDYDEVHLEIAFSRTQEKLEIRQMVLKDPPANILEVILDEMWAKAKESLRDKGYFN